jgi:hypothetical protein
VCGDRNWTNRKMIRACIIAHAPDVVIHGAARGADEIAGQEAIDLQVECVVAFPALWNKEKKAAGPIRNSRMLKRGEPTHVVAFHNNIEQSKGTADMVKKARAAGLPVEIITE